MGVLGKLKKLIPTYRVAENMEAQLQQMQEEIVRLHADLVEARVRMDEREAYRRRQNVLLRQEITEKFWLLQRRENENLDQVRRRVFLEYPNFFRRASRVGSDKGL